LTGDTLDCGDQAVLTLQPGAAFTITKQAAGTTTNLLNYSGCSGSGLAAGKSTTCTITNAIIASRSSALGTGYWKNHTSQMRCCLWSSAA
jgi:hypothetical protein